MRRYAAAALVLATALAPSCAAPTEVTLVLSTDVPCAELRGTSITVGHLGEIEQKPVTSTSTFCDASGDLGALVIVPSAGKSDEVAMKVIAGRGRDATSCVPPYGKGCVVARRSIRFVPHTPLRISVPLRAACDGVPCRDTETCVAGACYDALIADPNACSGSDGCGESTVTGQSSADAGADAASADAGADASAEAGLDAGPDADTAVYADMTQATSWSSINLKTVSPNAGGYIGGTFDGRYVYFAPNATAPNAYTGLVTRYDTQATFNLPSAWSTFDATTLDPEARAFAGAAFDGRYVYLVPNGTSTNGAGRVTRYDTQASFSAAGSWSTFNVATVNASATTFSGATFDGRYLYLVPSALLGPSIVTRYDTKATFTTAASWSTFDMMLLSSNARWYYGAVFDGRYIYLAPYSSGSLLVTRYDTQAAFGAIGSWTTFDIGSADVTGFMGAAFDGRYVYFAPTGSRSGSNASIMRYDTQGTFGSGASWEIFKLDVVSAYATAFAGALFEGRYVYFMGPSNGPADLVVRYDTRAKFAAAASWQTFTPGSLVPSAYSFIGAVFDGRYVYPVPTGYTFTAARFDAKTPPSLPALPAFFGSTL